MMLMALAGLPSARYAAVAQAPPAKLPQVRLDAVKRLKCVFTVAAVGSWVRPEPQARTVTAADLLTLEISDIELTEASATVRRGSERTSVSARSDRSNLYLFRIAGNGTAMATTVFSQETESGRLKAVHSEGGIGARQLYGECTILE